MRGKVFLPSRAGLVIRITPAYAGKSLGRSSENNFDWDHPRLCGEKASPLVRAYSISGSPPPMRGKDGCLQISGSGSGITPAYAGKSEALRAVGQGRADHPRLCREKMNNLRRNLVKQGSPPPMRGKAWHRLP